MSNGNVRNPYERLWKLEATVNKLILDGKRDPRKVADALQRIIEDATQWYKENGIIYFYVTSDGTMGEQWITRLENKGFCVDYLAKKVLSNPDYFKPTSGVTTKVAVLPGRLFEDDVRTIGHICAEAAIKNLIKPDVEVVCLIREKFTDKEIREMDLWWISGMHEPVKDSNGRSCLLYLSTTENSHGFSASTVELGLRFGRAHGFAFAVSSSSAEDSSDK